MADNQQQPNRESEVSLRPKQAVLGLNLDNTLISIPQGALSYALNAQLENFDGHQVTYQNEQANEHCVDFPDGYKVVGLKNIIERGFVVAFLSNPTTGDSEIGKVTHNTCTYETIINAKCLNFNVLHPILKAVHKVTSCSTEIYWTDAFNVRRFIDLDNLPFKELDECPPIQTQEVDCNKLSVQPNFSIPQIEIESVDSDGELIAGTYQFAVQYSNALGEAYTSYYSVTNPLPIQDPTKITLDFNYAVNKSINLRISNIDITGFYDYINVAVIKNINNITSVELVGTFSIVGEQREISYTGQNKEQIRLTVDDIFTKYPIYEIARDLTTTNDILIWDQLTSDERISYQKIANQISLKWQTYILKDTPGYSSPLNSVYRRQYMRDEVYPVELVLLLTNGKQTDGFHIPGRIALPDDLVPISNKDVIHGDLTNCEAPQPLPKWRVYNTGRIENFADEYLTASNPDCYEGPYQYGDFAYWESTDTYPCDPEIWGDLSGKPIRHHKFPDNLITHIHDNKGNIYPIGIRIDVQQVIDLVNNSDLTDDQKAKIKGFKIVRGNRATNKSVKAKGIIHNVGKYDRDSQTYYFPNFSFNDLRPNPYLATKETKDDSGVNTDLRLDAFSTDDSKKRYVFHSPDTHFYQPTLGNILKLETVEFGESVGHFVKVKQHARYKFLSSSAYGTALGVAVGVGFASATVGVSTQPFDGTAAFTAYQTFLAIMQQLLPKKNFAYQFNAVGRYTDYRAIPNSGDKQRRTDIQFYMAPGMQSVGDNHVVNNYQRESSVYLRSTDVFPFPSSIAGVPQDTSRYLCSQQLHPCGNEVSNAPVSSYYASIKTEFLNQYGQIYSYETIDTGFQWIINGTPTNRFQTVFGGDVFINKFAYKSKIPFFLDNRVGLPDESDVEYNEIPNVAFPIFWFSTDVKSDTGGNGGLLNFFKQLFGVKINNFDCPENKFFYQNGKIYLFSYGIPYFYAESEVNVDFRGAFNGKEGDFYPRMSSDIPDDWLQEINTTIQQDNTYHYNRSYSKQNKENQFTHLPIDFVQTNCRSKMEFRAIFSEKQEDVVNYSRNNWLIYKPVALFDFPRNYGSLVSLEGIEDRQVIARFENKTLLYNALLTAPTSAAEVYLGQSLFSTQVPPLDFQDTDLGYVGCQNKLFLKTEYGHITVDAKRGQVFLIQERSSGYGRMKPQATDISADGLSKFFTEYLDFQLKRAFPEVDIDNHLNGVGLHGVYDSKYDRLILTKIDYVPLSQSITYSDGKFYLGAAEIQLTDERYFCNRSFTISYCFKNRAWVSFHTYIPNFYIGESNYFYSGKNSAPALWRHNTAISKFNNFYGEIAPYHIEYPIAYQEKDEILHSIEDYTKVLKYDDFLTFIEDDDTYFNKLIAWSAQESSGILELVKKPKNNLNQYMKYPVYKTSSKEVTFTKVDNAYRVNTFWNLIVSPKKPVWKKSCTSVSILRDLNEENHSYAKRSFNKAPLRSRDLKLRYILDNKDDVKMVSQFIIPETQKSEI